MKRILVPTDFSPNADNALNFAVQIAKTVPSEIIILYCFEKMGPLYTDYMGANKEYNQQMMDKDFNRLATLKKSIEETENITVSAYQYQGPVSENILKAAKDNSADMIIMGTLGESGFKEQLWGSKTAEIISKSDIPVMAVPFNSSWTAPGKILFATSHFEEDDHLLGWIFEFSRSYMAEVHVMVFTDESSEFASKLYVDEKKIQEYAQMLDKRYKHSRVSAVHLTGTDFSGEVDRYIEKHGINMLAMINYHRSFVERLFHASKTRRMSYHTNIPLLSIPGH